MDKPRANPPKKRGKLYIALGIVGAVAITLGLSRLKPAPPSVDAELAWRDTVEMGPMVKQVRGPGTLVPEHIQIISALTSGRVEEKIIQPGQRVEPNTVLLRLSNPDEQLQLLNEQRQLGDARANLVSLTSNLESQRLTQSAAVSTLESQFKDAARTDSVDEELNAKNLINRNQYLADKNNLHTLKERLEYAQKQLEVMSNSVASQLGAQEDQVKQLEKIVQFREERIASMQVRANASGVLQRLGANNDLETGQYVLAGSEIARVVQPGKLKAVLRIPETQVVDVALGQEVEIDTRNGIVIGKVMRIDPASSAGTVGVDVSLPDSLPSSARPDLNVDGRIIVDRLPNVLHVQRQQYANQNSSIGLFRMEPDGKNASRVTVQIGAVSVNEMEIKGGLKAGNVVILSDMSQWDSYDRIRLR